MSVSAAAAPGEVVYAARGLSKRFGPIEACRAVDLDIRHGRLTAIVGDNGAGKSTLVKMLTGALQPDAGRLVLRGREAHFASPLDARRQRVEVVYQELALAPNLDAISNIFLGRELTRPVMGLPVLRRLDEARMRDLAREEIRRFNVKIPSIRGVPVGKLSGGQQQSVAIARAAFWTTDVLFMDEPTAALGVQEARAVLDLVRTILDRGVAVVMVSHILPHVLELADHVVVMRHGVKVADVPSDTVTMDDLIRLIVGA